MLDDLCLNDLTDILLKHENLIDSNILKYLERLLNYKKDQYFSSVYSILHIICTKDLYINNIPSHEHFIEKLKISIKCLEYLINQWTPSSQYPDNGIEKLLYTVINHQQSKLHFVEVEELLILAFKFKQKSSNSSDSILQACRQKVTTLKLSDIACTCHTNETASETNCSNIGFIRCCIISYAFRYISEEIDVVAYASSVGYLLDSLMKAKHCQCHCEKLYTSILYALDFFILEIKVPNDKISFLIWPKDFMANCFAFMHGLDKLNNSEKKSDCSSDHSYVKSVEDTTVTLESKLIELESLFKEEQCRKSMMTGLKYFSYQRMLQLFKVLNNYTSTQIPIKWSSFLPLWFNLYLRALAMIEHKSNTELFLRLYLLTCYEVVRLRDDLKVNIIVFNQFYQLLKDQPSYVKGSIKTIYGVIVNLGIKFEKRLFEHKNNIKRKEIEPFLSILLLIYPHFISREFKKDKNVLWLAKLTCKCLQLVGRPNDAMKYAAQSLVRFDSQHDFRKMVNYWIQILIGEMRKGDDEYFKFIDADLPTDCDPTIVDKALRCQLEICKHSVEKPPRSYYKMLTYLSTCGKTSTNRLTYIAVTSVLLHDLDCYFTNDRSPLELSTEVYNSLPTAQLKWEVEIIALYSYYICKWEVLLSEVWHTRKAFRLKLDEDKQKRCSYIEWFPKVTVLDRTTLSRVVSLCDANMNSIDAHFEFNSELVQALSIVGIILNLQGNVTSSLKLLIMQEKILEGVVKLEHMPMKFKFYLIRVKCQISNILCQLHIYKEALKYAVEGNKLHEELSSPKFENCQSATQFASMRVESKIALAKAYIYNKKIPQAMNLMAELKQDDFITRKRSFENSLYITKMKSVSAELYVARSMEEKSEMRGEEHPVEMIKDNLLNLIGTLDKACVGSCQAFYSLALASEDIPTFGNTSKHLVEKYLSLGNMKLAMNSILDGILLSRFYLLPERELQFQVFYTRCKLMTGEDELVRDQLSICDDVIQFIKNLEKGEMNPTRCRLFSETEADQKQREKSDFKEAVNNSSMMEDIGCDDLTNGDGGDDDVIIVETQPLDIKNNLVFDKKMMASPLFPPKKENALTKNPFAFMHSEGCKCRICVNVLMTKLQINLVEIHGLTIKADSVNIGVKCIKTAIDVLDIHSLNNINLLNKILGSTNTKTSDLVFFVEKMKATATLSSIYLDIGHKKPASALAVYGLTKLKGQPHILPLLKVQARFHLVLGQCMMSTYSATKIDHAKYLSLVVDSLSNHNNVYSCKNPKTPAVTFKKDKTNLVQPLAAMKVDTANIKNDKVFCSPAKVPNTKKKDKENLQCFQTPVKPFHARIKSLSTKTPKTARSSRLRTPIAKTKMKSSEFKIYTDDSAVPNISIKTATKPTAVKKLPVPDFPSPPPPNTEELSQSMNSLSLVSTARKKKTTKKRVVLSSSSSEEEEEVCTPPEVKKESPTPAAASRRPRRKAAEVSLQNIKAMRRNARRVYLKEEGLDYNEVEEPEVGRPLTKNRRNRRNAASNLDNDTLEIEYNREHVRQEKIAVPHDINPDIPAVGSGVIQSDDLSCVEHLLASFDFASSAGESYFIKTSLQLLSVEQNSINKTDQLANSKSSLFHLFSVGNTLRQTIHNYAAAKKCKIEANKMPGSMSESENDPKKYIAALEELRHNTSPCFFKSLMHNNDDITVFDDITSKLPGNWSVCVMSVLEQGPKSKFFVTRLRKGETPFHVQLDDSLTSEEIVKFNELFLLNVQTLKTKDIVLYWQQRKKVEKIMKLYIKDMENKILGIHRGILLGSICEETMSNSVANSVVTIHNVIESMQMQVDKRLIEIYLWVWSTFSSKEKTLAILNLFTTNDVTPTKEKFVKLAVLFQSKNITDLYREKRDHVILILGKGLQNLPWESTLPLFPHSVSRMPSLDMLRWHLQLLTLRKSDEVDLSNSVYIINPGGDLEKTEARFSDWFKSITEWEGVVGEPPAPNKWLSYMQNKDALFYLGHGDGNTYTRTDKLALQQSDCCVFLMGCSSARLADSGICDPNGTINLYLLSGAPCVVGCLWVVTDKDIDKFLIHLLSSWMKSGSSLLEHLRKSTEVLRMTYLNGASCVAYGLPVHTKSTVNKFFENMPDEYKNI